MMRQKIIRRLNLNSIRGQSLLRKMFQILCDNHIATTNNRRRQYVTIIGVGQIQRIDAAFITDNERIADFRVHSFARSFQLIAVSMRFVSDKRIDPFALNISRPFCLKQIIISKLKKNIPHGRWIQHIGIKQRGVLTHISRSPCPPAPGRQPQVDRERLRVGGQYPPCKPSHPPGGRGGEAPLCDRGFYPRQAD